MDKLTEYKDIAMSSVSSMTNEISKVLPNVLYAIIVLILGWLLTKIVVKIITKVLKLAKADKLDDKINEIELLGDKKMNFDIIKIVAKFVKWFMYIIILVIISDILNLTIISEEIGSLLSYLPKLFSALVIFTLGLLFANFLKKAIQSFFESMDLSGSKVISRIVFIIILVFVSVTALNQAGIDTNIITSNVTLILASLLLAFSIAFGLGAREIVADLLRTFYARKTYEIGQKIIYKDTTYEVVSIDHILVKLKGEKETLIVPIRDIIESHIKMQD